MKFNTVYAKILLFGEYSILTGSHALSVPFKHFKGRLNYLSQAKDHRLAVASNKFLKDYVQYLKERAELKNIINVDLLEEHTRYGLFFDSDIPLGYGLGSSGAVVSSVFQAYAEESAYKDLMKSENRLELKKNLGEMESFYHGKSSGIDPLSIILNKPLFFAGQEAKPIELNTSGLAGINVAVYDLGHQSTTRGLVKDYLNRYVNETSYRQKIETYSDLLNKSIDAFMRSDGDVFFNAMQKIAVYQLELFDQMLPVSAQQVIKEGIRTGTYAAKLCGSGGGGFLLLFYRHDQTSIFQDVEKIIELKF